MNSGAAVSKRPPASLLIVSGLAALVVLAPIVLTALRASAVSQGEALNLLVRPLVGELLLNTMSLTAVCVSAAALLSLTIAWFVERTQLPGRRFWSIIVAIPLAIPAFTTSFAWVSLSPDLQDFAGAALVVTCSYYPLIYLPVAAALRNMDPTLEESARMLGCGPFGCFFRVVLPQLRPALFGGMLLVALNVLTEFGAFALLRFRTFTTEIYAEYRASFDDPAASLLAAVLIVLCLLCLLAELRVRGDASYARIGSGVKRPRALYDLGWTRWVALAFFVVLSLVVVGVPVAMTVYWLTQASAAAVTPAESSPALLFQATLSSLEFGFGGAALAVALALPIGFLATRYRAPAITLIERATYLTQGVPGIVTALALVFLAVHYLNGLYESVMLLLIAYAIEFLCLAVVGVRTAFAHSQANLEETSRSLGSGRAATAWRVVLPLAGPGLAAAAAMVFISIVTELTATLLLAPIGTQTLATQIWADTSTLAFAAASRYVALLMILSFFATWLLASRFGRSKIGLQ